MCCERNHLDPVTKPLAPSHRVRCRGDKLVEFTFENAFEAVKHRADVSRKFQSFLPPEADDNSDSVVAGSGNRERIRPP